MSSQPQKTTLNETLNCKGFTIRTKNADEMNPETAKIGTLWQDFQSKLTKYMNENTQMYGVYDNYESDVNGSFDVSACIANLDTIDESLNELNQITISTGDYLVFHKQGEMPQAVIDAWGDVWHYFTDENCPHTRKYDSDFEKYIGMDTVEIYISIQN